MTYVALSRIRNLSDPVVEPITLERLQAPKKSPNLHFKIIEEQGLNKRAKKNSFHIYFEQQSGLKE